MNCFIRPGVRLMLGEMFAGDPVPIYLGGMYALDSAQQSFESQENS